MNRKTSILATLLLILCLGAGILHSYSKPQTTAGEKKIGITVFHGDGSVGSFSYQTDAIYLAEVLLETELAAGENGAYGLYITTVDGETADANKSEWWCITKGGERVNSGADALPLSDGDHFELTFTEGF